MRLRKIGPAWHLNSRESKVWYLALVHRPAIGTYAKEYLQISGRTMLRPNIDQRTAFAEEHFSKSSPPESGYGEDLQLRSSPNGPTNRQHG